MLQSLVWKVVQICSIFHPLTRHSMYYSGLDDMAVTFLVCIWICSPLHRHWHSMVRSNVSWCSLCPGDIHTTMFVAALFTTAKVWNQLVWPSSDICDIHKMEYYLVMKKKRILLFIVKWVKRKDILWSEANQTQEPRKINTTLFPCIWKLKKKN